MFYDVYLELDESVWLHTSLCDRCLILSGVVKVRPHHQDFCQPSV